MRTLSFLLAAGVAVSASAGAQIGPGSQSTGFLDQLRATGCPDGYWLQAQAAPDCIVIGPRRIGASASKAWRASG